ncbi:MAG: hypothetical protein K2M48_02785 [Clostridiales bacterium]|nr:hypothetical protein [Clostridiales bacterium]
MHLSKTQTFVITALNVVIIALVAIIFWTPLGSFSAAGGDGDGDSPTGGNVKEHVKLRTASAGKTPDILRETRLMGNGDETVVAVYFRGGVSYIFGNATVKGLDFDSYGGFLCLVNSAGTILSFTYFDGAIGAVGIISGGFAVGAGEKLYFVDNAGASEFKADTEGAVLDIQSVVTSPKIAVVTQPTGQSIRLCEYTVSEEEWAAGNATRIHSIRDLEYFGCYDFGESRYVVSARASSAPRYEALAFFSFTAGGEPTAYYEGGSVENITRPYAVVPYGEVFMSLVSRDGNAAVITLDESGADYRAKSLGFTADGARLFFVGNKYYACFERGAGAISYEIKDGLGYDRLDDWDGITVDRVLSLQTLTAVGHRDENTAVISPLSGKTTALDIENCVFYGGFENIDGYTFVLSATGGKALSSPTAERDIYIITVRN